MKKFLFLLDELPPTKSANGICAEKVMKSLKEDGYEVKCICWNSNGNDRFSTVIIPDKPWSRFAHKCLAKNSAISRIALLFGRIINRIKRYAMLPIWPVESFLVLKCFITESEKLIKEQGITDIVAVSYPGETLMAMKKLKKKYGAKIRTVMYPLDITLYGVPRGGKIEKAISSRFSAKFMRSCAKYADTVLVLENAQDCYNSIFPKSERKNFKICGIPLLEDKSGIVLPLSDSFATSEYNFVYTGSILANIRSPEYLFRCLDIIAKNVKKKIIFNLYGSMDSLTSELLKQNHWDFNFVNHGWVKEDNLDSVLQNSDLLINIGNEAKHLIPSKLFKYMSFGKPIFHLCLIKEDPCIPYLRKYKNAYILNKEDLMSQTKINSIVEFVNSHKTISVKIKELFPRCTPSYTAMLIENDYI